jgi:hypothetical protein
LKQELQLQLQLQLQSELPARSAFRPFNIVVGGNLSINRLLPYFKYLTDTAAGC